MINGPEGEARPAEATGIPPYAQFQDDLSTVYPLSAIEEGEARMGPGFQSATFVYAPEGIGDLLSQAHYVVDSRAQHKGRRSSGVGVFRTNVVRDRIDLVRSMWRKRFPQVSRPLEGHELYSVTFPDDEAQADFWEAAGVVARRYRELLDEWKGNEEVAVGYLHREIERDYPLMLPEEVAEPQMT